MLFRSIAPGSKKQIAIKHIILQNRTTTENSVILKYGSTSILPILLPTKGDGFTDEFHHCWEVGDNTQVILNLSSATDIGYVIAYWIDQD